MSEDRRAGFKERTRLAAARRRLLDAVRPHGRTESVPVGEADDRVLAEAVTAERPVPHYDRAAMDGYAVRATDTHGASQRSPAVLDAADAAGPGVAVPVHTGSAVPDGADAVVRVERTERVAGTVEVTAAVAPGENVAPVGEDVAAGETVLDAGQRLNPAALGLCQSVGRREVTAYEPPAVAVVPTGEELVRSDPAAGETVETNGLTVSRYVERWGGDARYRDVVPDDAGAIRTAIERDLDADLVATTGGSSVGERDLVPEVVADLGEVLVHGVALKPGHPVAVGVVEDTPVLVLPGYPVSCLVTAVQFLMPAVRRAGHRDAGVRETPAFPTTTARLGSKVASEPGVRQFVPVTLDRPDDAGGVDGESDVEAGDATDVDGDEDAGAARPTAVPVRSAGAGVLSAVTRADGWVVVPESREGFAADEVVTVERWGWSP